LMLGQRLNAPTFVKSSRPPSLVLNHLWPWLLYLLDSASLPGGTDPVIAPRRSSRNFSAAFALISANCLDFRSSLSASVRSRSPEWPSGSDIKASNLSSGTAWRRFSSRQPRFHWKSKTPIAALSLAHESVCLFSLSTNAAKRKPPAERAFRRLSVVSWPPPSLTQMPY